MPNPGADAPLRKVTLNLYEQDCIELERDYGWGWTVAVRDIIHNNRKRNDKLTVRTLGDIE